MPRQSPFSLFLKFFLPLAMLLAAGLVMFGQTEIQSEMTRLKSQETLNVGLQFLYQTPKAFAKLNQPDQLDRMKSDAGFAQVAGVELTLLDCARYFHKAAGINGVAQIAKDIGAKAEPRALAKAAAAYENSSVRRLGYVRR